MKSTLNPSPAGTRRLARVALRATTIIALLWATAPSAQVYRPERARRSISTEYHQLVIQKNSQIDLLAVQGQPLIDNAFPSVIFEDGKQEALDIDFRNTSRYSVNSPIGKGNGFHYASAECEWRIATYPADSFLTFDLTFINNSKKPVIVAGLVPLGTGKDQKGGVYLGNTNDTLMLRPPTLDDPFARIEQGLQASPGHLAAWSPSSGRTFVAGFLTHRGSLGAITLNQKTPSDNGFFDVFESVCVFSPPVTVGPGERLNAETLYVNMGSIVPQAALEHFVQASLAFEPFPTRAKLQGWMPQSIEDTSAASLLDNLAAAQRRMVPTGWTTMNLGACWATSPEGLTPDPQRFPEGLAPLVTAARSAGVTTITTTKAMQTNAYDASYDANALTSINIDVLELLATPSSVNDALPVPHPLLVQEAIEAATIQQPKIVFGRPVASGQFTLKDWALESRCYYLPAIGNPLLTPWARDLPQDTEHFTDDQFITAFTLAAIQGKNLRPKTPWTVLSPLRQHILSRLLPAPANSGQPLDLFQEGPPQRWYIPIHTKVGDWTIVALFNWEQASPVELSTPLTALGMNNDNLYTVYDFWAGQYLGLIEKSLRVEVPPEGVRLLGLRRYEKRPMLVASSRHYTQGASDHSALDWAHESRTLSGTFSGIKDEACTLSILVPESYVLGQATSSVEITSQKQTGPLLELTLRPPTNGDVEWKVSF